MAARTPAGTWTWLGGTSTDYTVWANWSTNATGAVSGDWPGWDASENAVVNGETIIFTGDCDYGCATATADWDGSTDGAAAKIIVTDSYNKGVGYASNPWSVSMANGAEVFIEGTLADNIYIKGVGTYDIPILTVLDLQAGKTIFIDGTIGSLNLMKGQVTTIATCTISTAVNVGYVSDATNDSTLVLTAGTTLTGSTVNAQGGTITNSINDTITNVTVGKAKWTNTVGTSGLITNLNQYGGQFIWNSGDITTAQIYDGTLNCSSGTEARTCAALYQYTPATVNTNDGRRWVTITAWHLMCEQPKIKVVPGQIISITGA